MPRPETLTHLANLYADDPDPWGHFTSAYERDKYAATLAAVGPGPFDFGLEIGCGNGALAELLAPRCRRLIAVECIAHAASEARRRLAGHRNAEVVEADAAHDLPDISPDLIVMSEVLYFWRRAEIDSLAAWINRQAAPGARIVVVNWLGETGESLSGTEAADRLAAGLSGWLSSRKRRNGFLLDVYDLPQGTEDGATCFNT